MNDRNYYLSRLSDDELLLYAAAGGRFPGCLVGRAKTIVRMLDRVLAEGSPKLSQVIFERVETAEETVNTGDAVAA